MPQVFNDLGNGSSEPCGFTVGDLCGAADYGSWFRTAQIIDSQLAVIETAPDASVSDKVKATSMRMEFLQFPVGTSLRVSFFPTDRTHAIARWCQDAADFVTSISEEGRGLPANIFTPPPPSGSPFGWLSTGVLVGVGAGIFGLWYLNKQGVFGKR